MREVKFKRKRKKEREISDFSSLMFRVEGEVLNDVVMVNWSVTEFPSTALFTSNDIYTPAKHHA